MHRFHCLLQNTRAEIRKDDEGADGTPVVCKRCVFHRRRPSHHQCVGRRHCEGTVASNELCASLSCPLLRCLAWVCHVADLEYKVVGVPPHVQVSVASDRGARQQCDSPTAKPRPVCGLQPLQHSHHHEHARPGERTPHPVYSVSPSSFSQLIIC